MIHDEFTKLEKCLVGISYKSCDIKGLDKIIDETNEDLNELENILVKQNVKVLRPIQPKFSIDLHHPIMPRDIFGFYGNKMFQTFGAIHSRFEEHTLYSDVVRDCLDDYELFKMWKPDIDKTEDYDIIEDHSNKIKIQQRYDKYKNMILWETANFIKCGDCIIHTQSADKDPKNGKGTEKGLEWMKSLLTEYKFIEVSAGGHIDGKIALLRPGLLMTWREKFIPEELKNWDKIIIKDNSKFPKEFKETRKKRFYTDYVMKYLSDWVGYSKETWFDVNCLSVDENTIITTGNDIENIKNIEKHQIDVITWNHRHRYFWDGGAHCCSQDISRTGKMESYV